TKDVFVDVDTGINTAIRKIRLALGDSPESPAFVETVPGKGYRFIAAVEAAGVAAPKPARPRLRTRLTAGLVAVTVLTGLATWAWFVTHAPASRVTLAVLPFENLPIDPEREYLADGLAEDTIATLGQVDPEHMGVIGRTSMMAYKRTTKSLAEIGRELGAEYLVESTIQAENGRLRIISK